MTIETLKLLPWIPAVGAGLCGICCASRPLRKLAGFICVASILAAFALAVGAYVEWDGEPAVVTAFEWITVNDLSVNFGYYIDGLTMLMLFVVTGIGSLIAWYATGYMKGDRGYARFFAGVALFIFAMTTLVMADNLVLLYLGWEGVGLCSYLLIGYYYDKPFAVEAAKKAFIVNRIGDLGFALGIFLTWQTFGSLSVQEVLAQARHLLESGAEPQAAHLWIPFLLMLGAFGKSAQGPLYVWLPDAMAGPTPVSALVHAATMVTSGVYMIARTIPLFELSPYALPTVAVVGGVTALYAATIALTSNDLKGVFAYSTVSQLGYMFLGVGALSTVGGVFHLFTHAFFKALLFLTAGSVMHALAGQLDIRTMGGLRHRMPVTCWLMFVGCLALAGVPPLAGFFSKDTILHDAMARGLAGEPIYTLLAILGLVTAFMTAYYTFRLWFRVFMGDEKYEMGDEHHAPAPGSNDAHAHGYTEDHHHAPHEMPLWQMNFPLMILAVGSILVGVAFAGPDGWVARSIAASTADTHFHPHPDGILGMSLHTNLAILSGLLAVAGIAVAAYFHWLKPEAGAAAGEKFAPIVKLLVNKYYVDEIYDAVIVNPLRRTGRAFNWIDDNLIQMLGVEWLGGGLVRLVGWCVSFTQHGRLQGYGVGMAAGIAVIVIIVYFELM